MPKVYSEEEKQQIISSLKSAANILLQEKGVKKTTVDELVSRTGIPKGTFYLFYPSKEMLLFDVTQDFHKDVDEYIASGMNKIISDKKINLKRNPDFSKCVEDITDVILGAMEITYNSCLKILLNPADMNLILSKIPQNVLTEHLKSDTDLGNGIFQLMAEKKGIDPEVLTGSFMLTIFGGMYKREVGENNWRECMRMQIRGLVIQLVK